MADENDPNRPEGDPPETRTPGENDNAHLEQPNEPLPAVEDTLGAVEPVTDEASPEAAPEPTVEPEPAAPLYAAEAIAEPDLAAPAVEEPAAPSGGALPPNYFRAAGDPDEPPPEEPPPTLLNQARAKANEYWTRFRTYAEPRWVKFSGAARAFAGEMWNRIRGIKRPKNVREAAVWGGWIAAGGVAFIIAFFLFITWGLPSTDDLWEARQGQSITFVDRNGHVILREGAQNAPPVDLGTLPPYVAQAFIAYEDEVSDSKAQYAAINLMVATLQTFVTTEILAVSGIGTTV